MVAGLSHENIVQVFDAGEVDGRYFMAMELIEGQTLGEYLDEKGRLWLYITGWVAWVFGIAFLALLAWLCGEWFSYGLVTTLSNLLLIPFFW